MGYKKIIYRGALMKVSKLQYEDLTNEVVDKILFEDINDYEYNGDCILVLGSKIAHKYRVPKAVDLYNAKRSNSILLSGGTIVESEYGLISEAELMKIKAIELGIPVENLIIETKSKTTQENMICSLLSLERTKKLTNIKSILLVTTRYHMRRSLMMAETFMPKWIKVYSCPADDTNTLRYNWFLTERNAKLAKDEAYKISYYIREGYIADFDI